MRMMDVNFLANMREFFESYEDLEELNEQLGARTGIIQFFNSFEAFDEFKRFLKNYPIELDRIRGLGDFQTPEHLTDLICKYLADIKVTPKVLIEPTCGTGNFIFSALKYFPSLKYLYCIEIQSTYEWLFKLKLLRSFFTNKLNVDLEFHCDNIFRHNFSNEFLHKLDSYNKDILILGNPPWITNTELSVLNSDNVPKKSNIKGVKGIEALTGKANFDIAEFIILHLIQKFSDRTTKLAMLCKTVVTRNILKSLYKMDLKIANIKSLSIDAKKEFNINTDAGLFLADIGKEGNGICSFLSLYKPDAPINTYGWINAKFVSNLDLYTKVQQLEGSSPLIWRQGVKHDASKVMILTINGDKMLNGLNEIVDIEHNLLFPFLKSSDLKSKVIRNSNKIMIITQTELKEETDSIALKYPKLWDYLLLHAAYLDKRKSNIYKHRPRFSIFGIGDYAFKPYKIAISGFYKKLNFSLILPIRDKPVMLDDTCYYLYFDNYDDAIFTWILLNQNATLEFLSSIVFLDSKRPYTKEILMRLDLKKLGHTMDFDYLLNYYQQNLEVFLDYEPNKSKYKLYLKQLEN